MSYSTKEFASLTGVTPRTLRHYDAIGLLQPKRIAKSGYRVYDVDEIEKMQHILFLKKLEVPLKTIQQLLSEEEVDYLSLLRKHQASLRTKEKEIQDLLTLVAHSIAEKEGKKQMSPQEKFETFKQEVIRTNEAKYGEEIREKYGEEAVNKANHNLLNMTDKEYEERQETEKQLLSLLANKNLMVPSDEAKQLFDLHKVWISSAWGHYSSEAHRGLAQMYTQTPDFTNYYDNQTYTGATLVLEKVITFYA